MALQLRPNCERCDCDLPHDADNAMICSYECTFCRDCVDRFENVCPNCGGGFVLRPVRPSTAWREGVSIAHQPASTKRVNTPYSDEQLKMHSARIKDILPNKR